MLLFLIFSIFYGLYQQALAIDCSSINKTVVSPFDINKYTGVWYEYADSTNHLYLPYGDCPQTHYNFSDDTKDDLVLEKFIGSRLQDITQILTGHASVDSDACNTEFSTTCGKLKIGIKLNNETIILFGNYWILDTDYSSFSIVWSCSISEYSYIVTRDRVPSADVIFKIKNALAKHNMKNFNEWRFANQLNC